MELAEEQIRPSDIITSPAIANALCVLLAIGGSTNGIVHMAAIAGRLGIRLDLESLDAMGMETPVLVALKPNGDYYMDDFVIEYLQDTVDRLKGKPEYRNWIKEIETMGHHSAKDIETALDKVEYTESGMNQGGDVSTEAFFD